MITPTMLQALQEEFTRERQNHATYRAMMNAFASVNYPGFAAWARHASHEEQNHADWFAEEIISRGGQPVSETLTAIAVPSALDPAAVFQFALDTEKATTAALNEIDRLAETLEDSQTEAFLVWFLKEQTRSEREITDILQTLRRVDAVGWMLLDKQLGNK